MIIIVILVRLVNVRMMEELWRKRLGKGGGEGLLLIGGLGVSDGLFRIMI